jgi:hypothetical protein
MKTAAICFFLIGVLLCTLSGTAQMSSATTQMPSADESLTKAQIASSKLTVFSCRWLTVEPGETVLLSMKDPPRNFGLGLNMQSWSKACEDYNLTPAQCQRNKIELTCACYQEVDPPALPGFLGGPVIRCRQAYLVNGHNLAREHKLAELAAQRKRQEAESKKFAESGLIDCTNPGGKPSGLLKMRGEDDSHCRAPKKGEPGYLPWN